MSHLIFDAIVQAKVEGRKPHFTAPMVRWITEMSGKIS